MRRWMGACSMGTERTQDEKRTVLRRVMETMLGNLCSDGLVAKDW